MLDLALLIGARLGPYEIVEALGAGGMGEVYKARDTRLDRVVALKILVDMLAADPGFRDRFNREARAISSLDHPNICPLYDVGSEAGHAYLVMRFIDGETLSERLTRGAMPIEDALSVADQIAAALDAAHEKGIVHRDLKPGNVMIALDGTVQVLDFGLAKDSAPPAAGSPSMSPTVMAGITRDGTILGTAAYMSPEQARGGLVDKRADIWAFGCVGYEMLTGRRLFRGESPSDVIAAVMKDEPDWSALPPSTPRYVRAVLQRCLQKDPRRRQRDIGDARLELQESAPIAVAGSPERARSRGAAGWIGGGALGIVATAAAFWLLPTRSATAPPEVMRLEITTPPTTDAESFALAPDGRTIAFVATADGVSRLWLRPLREAAAHALPETDGATQPFWSSDSRSIGFFADRKLKRVEAAGGTPQVLAEAPLPRGGAWNRDGIIVFAPCTPCGLVKVAASGGPVTPVSAPAKGSASSHRWPEFLPGGRVMFFGMLGPIQSRGLYLGSLDGAPPKHIADAESGAAFAAPDHLLFVRQGALLAVRFDPDRGAVSSDPVIVGDTVGSAIRGAFSVSASGLLAYRAAVVDRRQLAWMDRAGNTLNTLGVPDEGQMASPELGPDGRRIIVQRFQQGNVDLWSVDAASGVPTRLTFDPAADAHAVWAPDGRRIVYGAAGNGRDGMHQKLLSGGSQDQVVRGGDSRAIPVDWSPDGRFVLYQAQDPKSGGDLWGLPIDGGAPFPIAQTPFDDIGGQLSPDGKWVAYQSDASGRAEIYIRPFHDSGQAVQVSRAGGTQPRWARNGRELFYVAFDGRLTSLPIRASGQALDPGTPTPLFEVRLVTGPNIVPGRAQYAVAADGRFLVNLRVGTASAPPIAIVSNWSQLVRER